MLPVFFFPSLFIGVIPEPVHDVGSLQRGVGDEVLVLQPRLWPVRRLHLLLTLLHKVQWNWGDLTLCLALSLIPGNLWLQKKLGFDNNCQGSNEDSPCSGGRCCRIAFPSSAIDDRAKVAQTHTSRIYFKSYAFDDMELLWTLCSCSMHGSVKTTQQSISPRLSSTLWLLSSWSLMKSGQSSSTSCPMFRMAEMTWLQGLSKWAIREDLKYKAKGETIGWITCWGIFWSHTLRLAEAAPRSNPANQQVSCLRGGKATSAIGPNVLKIFSFTESCNSCHASFSLYWSCCHSQINSHVQWFASVEHSPTSSLCRHSLRLPGVKYTWEFVTHIYLYHIYYRTYL